MVSTPRHSRSQPVSHCTTGTSSVASRSRHPYRDASFKIALLRRMGQSMSGRTPTRREVPKTSTGTRSSTVTHRHAFMIHIRTRYFSVGRFWSVMHAGPWPDVLSQQRHSATVASLVDVADGGEESLHAWIAEVQGVFVDEGAVALVAGQNIERRADNMGRRGLGARRGRWARRGGGSRDASTPSGTPRASRDTPGRPRRR